MSKNLREAAERVLLDVSGRYRPDLGYNDLPPFHQASVDLAESFLMDLHEAAERLLRYSEWESNHYMPADGDPYRDETGFTQSKPLHAEDKAEIVADYLAAYHADDWEPVTAVWLQSSGIQRGSVSRVDEPTCSWRHGDPAGFEINITLPSGGSVSLIPVKTRGDVRRVFRAVGVTLKEPSTRSIFMQTIIEVENQEEAELIGVGLSDQTTRAVVKVMGALLPLSSQRERRRVLANVTDHFAKQAEIAAAVTE